MSVAQTVAEMVAERHLIAAVEAWRKRGWGTDDIREAWDALERARHHDEHADRLARAGLESQP